MVIRRDSWTTILSIVAAITLSLAASAHAAGRARSQDHRGPNLGGQAIPGGPSIRCVVPFCGNSFNPHGTRPRVQDHRPGANVPPVVNTTVAQPRAGRPSGPPRP